MARATAAVATLLATRARRRFGGTNSAGRGRRNAACALHPAQDGRVRGTRRDVREPSCRRLALCVLQVRVQLALASAPVGLSVFPASSGAAVSGQACCLFVGGTHAPAPGRRWTI